MDTNGGSGMAFQPESHMCQSKPGAFRGQHRGVNHSIEASVTFQVPTAQVLQDMHNVSEAVDQGWFIYSRSYNPTVSRLGQMVADMEGTEAGYACSSGIGAVASVVMTLCDAGDHVISPEVIYGGTFSLLNKFLPKKAGITTTFVPLDDLAALAAAFTPRTKLVITEVVANPTLAVADISAVAALAHAHGAQLVVDNTFTPLVVSPAKLGADIVIHSLTKFVSGGADIIGGAICGSRALIDNMLNFDDGSIVMLGPVMDPKIAHDLSMRMPHLSLRMREHSRRAAAMAETLQNLGAKVVYPGLSSHPRHQLMKKMVNPGYGYGGMLTIDLGTKELASQFIEELQNVHGFGLVAVSLGYFDTLMCISAGSTARELGPNGTISTGLIRMSVGLTGTLEERLEQLEAAYKHVTSEHRDHVAGKHASDE